jgi:acetoin utilization protein AcuB
MLVKSQMSTYPLTIAPEESISNAHHFMSQHKIRHLPVVTSNAKMVGLITENDLLKAEPSGATTLNVWEIHSLLLKVKVEEVMVKNVITVSEDTPIEEAAQLMLDNKIGCLPVIREGKLVGIITESDIFLTFMKLFGAREKGVRITVECPYRSGELAKVTKAIANVGGILVACGTIHLEDTNKGRIIFKVRNVDHEIITDALSKIEELDIIDNRKA